MASELWKKHERERTRTLHATTSRRTVAEKLRLLRTFKHWRKAGHEKQVILKRLKTSMPTLKKWAGELEFDLGEGAKGGSNRTCGQECPHHLGGSADA